jgi:hypothetical protein
MVLLSWREVDFPGVALAGLVAGYVMAIAGLWAGRVPGLMALDIADFGRRYMISDRPSAWFVGLASHLVNSVLLVFVWASAVLPNLGGLPGPRWCQAVGYGAALSLLLAGALVAPGAGLGFMGRRTGKARFAITNLLVHLMWGLLVGVLYVP